MVLLVSKTHKAQQQGEHLNRQLLINRFDPSVGNWKYRMQNDGNDPKENIFRTHQHLHRLHHTHISRK